MLGYVFKKLRLFLMHKIISNLSLFVYTLFLPVLTVAATPVVGMGRVADDLMDPVSVFSDFTSTISIMIGACFLFASVIKYMQHRVNPLAVPISNVVMLVIMAIVLILLPLAYKLTGGDIFSNVS
jgi:choline-glycine betaine transporter